MQNFAEKYAQFREKLHKIAFFDKFCINLFGEPKAKNAKFVCFFYERNAKKYDIFDENK